MAEIIGEEIKDNTDDLANKDIQQEEYNEEHNTLNTDKIGVDEIRKAFQTLQKYKAGKKALEERIVKNEQWWKLRHWQTLEKGAAEDPKPTSAWLFNCIISKHADFMDSFPSPVILPREAGDKQEAQSLSSIIPVVLEQNEFESTYSDEAYYKLKNGTGCFGVFWDGAKLNGLGDISIKCIDLLTLYWEAGVTDIQDSRNLFSVELVDNDVLEEQFPVCKGKLHSGTDATIKKYITDENIDTTNKSLVIDWYYKRVVNGKKVLHYCKFVDEIVLYATENDTKQPTTQQMVAGADGMPVMVEVPTGEPMSVKGWYDHGMYPFVFDVLFKEEGMPVGFGFIDICKNPQMSIDAINNAIEKSALMNANPRYFYRQDGSINEDEFLNPSKTLVHVSGNLGEDSIRPIEQAKLDAIYLTILNNKIDEMKETAGNRDTNNGGTSAGVTAASAIAAMQEQSGKTSRDQIKTTYRAYQQVINLCIELIRQFYDQNRQFRIIGDRGREQFVSYNNAGIKEQYQGVEFGVDMGYRLPVFDIKVSAQKENKYSQLSQNELALQFYNAGFFNPEATDQVLACLDMMEFQGKDEMMQKLEQNGGMYRQMIMMQQQLLQLSEIVDSQNGTNFAENMAAGILGQQAPQGGSVNLDEYGSNVNGEEGTHMQKAREQAASSTSPR